MSAVLLLISLVPLGLLVHNMLRWPKVTTRTAGCAETVSVLIPARNEERHIRAALEAVRAQKGPIIEILVYDDHSTDRTAEIVTAMAQADARIQRVAPSPLPEGWCGKPFACTRLAASARGDWLLFLDADAILMPDAIVRMLCEVRQRNATLLSCWPALDARGTIERLCMPLLNHVVFTLFPAELSLRRDWPCLGLAHGACLLIRRAEYLRTGGHAMVRGELFEDTALARAWRARGLRSICLDGQDVVRVRMYDSFAAMWRGFQKIIYPAFRREWSFWLFVILRATIGLVPFVLAPVLTATGRDALAAWGAAAVWLGRAIQAIRFGDAGWSVVAHPVAESLLILLALATWGRCHFGSGVEWKGRTYAGFRRRG